MKWSFLSKFSEIGFIFLTDPPPNRGRGTPTYQVIYIVKAHPPRQRAEGLQQNYTAAAQPSRFRGSRAAVFPIVASFMCPHFASYPHFHGNRCIHPQILTRGFSSHSSHLPPHHQHTLMTVSLKLRRLVQHINFLCP